MENRILKSFAILAVMVAMTGLAIADPSPGAVFAVDSNGNDTNLYPGTQIYIYGHHLAENSLFNWTIYDMDAGGTVVNTGNSGTNTTNATGSIFPYEPTGFTIGGSSDYKLVVTIGPNDIQYAEFYTKVDTLMPIPELSTIILISAGIIGVFALVRLRKKD